MTARDRSSHDRFTANDVARFCGVDLKTIHNWANKGKLPHARTEGRHLRFRRIELVGFLRTYGIAIPSALSNGRPRVIVIDADPVSLAATKRALAKRFDAIACATLTEGLVAIGASDPDAAVIDLANEHHDVLASVRVLASTESTKHVRIIAIADDDARKDAALAAGASAFVRKSPPLKLRDMLEELTGLTSPP